MKIFDSLIGNEEIKKTLGASILNSCFSHAYIIEGAKGTGKKTVATLACAAILCQSELERPCGKCISCRKVLSGSHGDVRFFEVSKIDQIREIKGKLYDSPTESDFKFYIFDDAHKMNIKAQNALLISLEEPPKNVVFFLLTADAGALLETIRSRAQILRTERLDKDVILSELKKTDCALSDEKLKEIVMASAGSLGYALDLIDEKKSEALIERRRRALDFSLAVIKNDADSVSTLMSYSSMQREDLKELLSLCVTIVGDLILLKKDKGAPLYFFTSGAEAMAISQKHHLPRLLASYDALLTAISDVNMNSNTALTLMSILINSKRKGS